MYREEYRLNIERGLVIVVRSKGTAPELNTTISIDGAEYIIKGVEADRGHDPYKEGKMIGILTELKE